MAMVARTRDAEKRSRYVYKNQTIPPPIPIIKNHERIAKTTMMNGLGQTNTTIPERMPQANSNMPHTPSFGGNDALHNAKTFALGKY